MEGRKSLHRKLGYSLIDRFFFLIFSKARESAVILPPLLLHVFSCGRAGLYLYVVQFNGHSNILNYLNI